MNYDSLAELYEQQYAHYRDDFAFYRGLAQDYGSPVLELGAGSARISLALAQAGHQVVAVETSAAMIAHGQKRLHAAQCQDYVRYVQADMTSLQLNEHFPLIIAPFNTLMHAYTLTQQDACLAAVRAHLAPGGLFACDLYTPNFAQLDVLRREAVWQHVGGQQSELFVLQHHDPDMQMLESRYYLDTCDSEGYVRRQTFFLRQRYYQRFELERALQQAGFSKVRLYGDFDKRRYSQQAPLMVVLASLA